MGRFYMLVLLLSAALGCRTMTFASGKKDKDLAADSRPSESSPDLPGYSLICALTKEATANDTEAETGCLLVDTDKRKLKIADIAVSWQWTFQQPEDTAVTVRVEEQGETATFHAKYFFDGPDAETVNSEVDRTTVMVPMTLRDGNKEVTEQSVIAEVRDDSILDEAVPP